MDKQPVKLQKVMIDPVIIPDRPEDAQRFRDFVARLTPGELRALLRVPKRGVVRVKPLMSLLVFSIGLMSCGPVNQEPKYRDDRMKASIAAMVMDTVFLDYRLGMSREEFQAHTLSMENSGKLIPNSERKLEYHLETGGYPRKLTAQFRPDYHNDTLYRLTVAFTNPDGGAMDKLAMLEVYDLLRKRYGVLGWYEYPGLLKGTTNYSRVIGATSIEVYQALYDSRVVYTHVPLETRALAAEREARQERGQSAASDL